MLENNQKKELVLLKDLGYKFPKESSKQKRRFGLYRCYCGNEFETQTSRINNGSTKSCGCNKGNKKHNLRYHRLYKTWLNMVQRCHQENNSNYKNYGLKGIKVCDKWHNIENFIEDMYPSYAEGLTLDRINPHGDYEKSNCRWATKTIQARNTRRIMATNKSGYRGVHYNKRDKKWVSQITIDKKVIYLGTFKTSIEAAKAYDKYVIDNGLEHTTNFN